MGCEERNADQDLQPRRRAEAFSPDGTTLATAGGPDNSSTYLWDVATGRKIAMLTDHQHSRIKSVAFSASGGLLAVNAVNGTVYVWKLPGGGAPSIHAVLSLQGFVNSDAVAFSPRGATLVMGGSDGQAYLWSASTGNIRALAAPVGSEITSVAYSPDGQELAAGDTGGVTYVWNLATGDGVTLPDPDSMGIESVAFGPGNESLATGDTNGKTYLWHLPAIKPVKTLANPTTASAPRRAAVFSVAFSPGARSPPSTRTATRTCGRCADPADLAGQADQAGWALRRPAAGITELSRA